MILKKLKKKTNFTLFLFAVMLISAVSSHILPSITAKPEIFLNLAKVWSFCLPETKQRPAWDSCKDSVTIKVPHLHSPNAGIENFNWLLYKTEFDTPIECMKEKCAFLATEIGDASTIKINGVELKTHGSFPPKVEYAKHYPVYFEVPEDILLKNRANSIEILAYSTKVPQSGIRGSVVAITSLSSAKRVVLGHIIYVILIPVVIAILLILACIPIYLLSKRVKASKELLRSYVRTNVAFSLFMLSFSNLPREIFPIWFAGHLHFLVRYLSDWALFDLVTRYLKFEGKKLKVLHGFYGAVVLVFIGSTVFQFFMNDFFRASVSPGIPYKITTKIFVLKMLPMIFGIWGAIRATDKNRVMLLSFFIPLLMMQINDIAYFLGFISSIYYIKFYPLAIAGFMAYLVLKEFSKETSAKQAIISKNAATGETAKQVAHDYSSPKIAYETYVKNLTAKQVSEEVKLKLLDFSQIFTEFYNKLVSISETTKKEQLKTELIAPILSSVLYDKNMELKQVCSKNVIISDSGLDKGQFVFASLKKNDFKCALSNILNNSIEAIEGKEGIIQLKLFYSDRFINITIEDNGKGIPKDKMEKIFEKSFSYEKEQGKGLGLYKAKNVIEGLGGSIQIDETKTNGTRINITIPRSDEPKWFLKELDITGYKKIVLADDFEGIIQTWKEKLSPFNKKVICFQSVQKLSSFIEENGTENTLFLIDNEFTREGVFGLDFIIKEKLQDRAILVTSYYSDETVLQLCEDNSIRMIPKSIMSGFKVTCKNITTKVSDIVVIDDDKMVKFTWDIESQKQGFDYDFYRSPEEFLLITEKYSKDILIILDQNLGLEKSGTEFKKDLLSLGFKNIYLNTTDLEILKNHENILRKEVPTYLIEEHQKNSARSSLNI